MTKQHHKKVTKEDTAMFFAMVTLLKTVVHYGEYMKENKVGSGLVMHELGITTSRIKNFLSTLYKQSSEEAKKMWDKELGEKDYKTFASLVETMAEMNDDQRAVIEEFTNQLKAGKIKIDYENS